MPSSPVPPERSEGGPSDKAVAAAVSALDVVDGRKWAGATRNEMVDPALAAAHDPALGLDRSVCLRDVVEALSRAGYRGRYGVRGAADFIEREFGGSCDHEWVDVRNSSVKSGDLCFKCGAIRPTQKVVP